MKWHLPFQREGKSRIWETVGSNYKPPMFVPGYNNTSEAKEHQDYLFKSWLEDRYRYEGKDCVDKVHNIWRMGIPTSTSAVRNLLRYRLPITAPKPDFWYTAVQFAKKHFAFMGDSIINFDFDYCSKALNQQSSPGFPYSRGYKGAPPFQTKEQFFKYNEGKFAREEFLEYVEQISVEPDSYRPFEFYTCSPKKELRKIKKIKEDAFRAYLAASVRNSMAGFALTGDMNQKFYSSWSHSSAFVGGSTFHGCWNKLFQRLSKHKNAFECDVSSWDATLSEEMIQSLSDVMWSFVRWSHRTPLNKRRWDNIFKEIAYSFVICPNGDIFYKAQGNPSGSFLTIVTNTIIHYMLFAYAWCVLHPDNTSYEEFDECVKLALCGDDSLYTVSDRCVAWYNLESITCIWQTLGVQAKVEATGSGPLVERSFLSQKTRLIGSTYMPYPDYDKTISSMIWHSRADEHIRWSYLKACALRLSTFFHPDLREVFASYISYLELRHKPELESPCLKKGGDIFSWAEVKSVYKTDDELAYLYSAGENRLGAVKQVSGLKFRISICLDVEGCYCQEDQEEREAEGRCKICQRTKDGEPSVSRHIVQVQRQ